MFEMPVTGDVDPVEGDAAGGEPDGGGPVSGDTGLAKFCNTTMPDGTVNNANC